MSAFTHYNLVGAFGLSVDRLSQMFLCVEASYCFDPEDPNTYHTHVHAADVTLTVRALARERKRPRYSSVSCE